VDVFGDTGYNFDSRCTFKLYVLFYRLSHFCALTQCCIAKNGGGYTQRGVANGLKVPCLFMITEVSIRCQKNPGGWYTPYTRVYPPIHHCFDQARRQGGALGACTHTPK